MDFRHLESVIAVADERSFSEAAHKMYVSQPALSQLIKRVEHEVQVVIFDRSQYPVAPTEAGALFITRAREMLQAYRDTQRDLRTLLHGAANRVTVGATSMMGGLLFPTLLKDLRAADLPVDVVPIESSSRELEELMDKEVIDFSIMTTPSQPDRFSYEPVVLDEFVYALPANHRLSSAARGKLFMDREVSLKQLKDEPFLMTKSGGVRSNLDSFFAGNEFSPRVIFESRSVDTLLCLVSAGLGVSALPKMLIRRELNGNKLDVVYARSSNPSPEVPVGIAHKKRRPLNTHGERAAEFTRTKILEQLAWLNNPAR